MNEYVYIKPNYNRQNTITTMKDNSYYNKLIKCKSL